MFTNSHRRVNDPLNWYWFADGLSNEDIEKIENYAKYLPRKLAGVTIDNHDDPELRKSVIRWIPRNADTQWLYDKLLNLADRANEDLWKFDMYDSKELIQYTEYYEDGGHYDYHLDLGTGDLLSQRKISLTVQLSEADEYEGGNFEILRGTSPEVLPRKKGAVLLFPSYILHRVTPVKSGTRKSLVLWMGGASFK